MKDSKKSCIKHFALIGLYSQLAFASGEIKLESSGFLRTAEERPNSVSTFTVGPKFTTESQWIKFSGDLFGVMQVQDRSSFTIEGSELYVGTSANKLGTQSFALGRKKEENFQFEEEWRLGFLTPRFLWDPLKPQSIGKTGLFYSNALSSKVKLNTYFSPLSIPERGFPVRNENGSLVSSSALYIEPYREAVFSNQKIPIKYSVDYPEKISDLLLNANGSVELTYQSQVQENNGTIQNKGFWTKGLIGLLPIYQVDTPIEGSYVPSSNQIDIIIHPQMLLREVVSIEAGVDEKNYQFWSTLAYDKPKVKEISSQWTSARNGPATLIVVGGGYQLLSRLNLQGSFLYIEEDPSPIRQDAAFTVNLPGRFNFKKAFKLGLSHQSNDRLRYDGQWTSDLENDSNLYSFDINYVIIPEGNPLKVNLGLDLIQSTTGKGNFGQFVGNDRFRGGLAYAF